MTTTSLKLFIENHFVNYKEALNMNLKFIDVLQFSRSQDVGGKSISVIVAMTIDHQTEP